MPAQSVDGSGGERLEAWWLRLPDPVLALLSTLLIAAADPKLGRRLRFTAVGILPAAFGSMVFGMLAWGRPHHEHAVGLWIWSAFLFLLAAASVAWVARASTRDIERREFPADEDTDALPAEAQR